MNRPGDYSNFTDAQLAEWHQLITRVDRLNALLLEEQKKNAQLSADARSAKEELQRVHEEYRDDFARLSSKVQEVIDAGLRCRNELAFLRQHLPAILADWLAPFGAFTDAALTPEFVERRKTVTELLRILEPFAK
jgi:hypothetical protein